MHRHSGVLYIQCQCQLGAADAGRPAGPAHALHLASFINPRAAASGDGGTIQTLLLMRPAHVATLRVRVKLMGLITIRAG